MIILPTLEYSSRNAKLNRDHADPKYRSLPYLPLFLTSYSEQDISCLANSHYP